MFVLNKTYNALLDLQSKTEKLNERNLNLFLEAASERNTLFKENQDLIKQNKDMKERIINEVSKLGPSITKQELISLINNI